MHYGCLNLNNFRGFKMGPVLQQLCGLLTTWYTHILKIGRLHKHNVEQQPHNSDYRNEYHRKM